MIVADFSDQVRPGVAPMVFGRAPLPQRPGWCYVGADGVAMCFRHVESGVPVWTWWLAYADHCRWSVLVPRTQTVEHARALARDFGIGHQATHHVDHDGDHRIFVTAMRWGSTWTRGGTS